jgi:hypothetical protein
MDTVLNDWLGFPILDNNKGLLPFGQFDQVCGGVKLR